MSHQFVIYPDDAKEELAETVKIEKVIVPLDSLFVGQGYKKHSGAKWPRNYYLQDHIDLTLEDVELEDVIYIAYGTCLSIAAKDQ